MKEKPKGEYLAVTVCTSGYPGPAMYVCLKMPQGDVYFKHFIRKAYPQHGVFVGLVHALAQMKKDGISIPLYSSDMTALAWVRNKWCTTEWDRHQMEDTRNLVNRAIRWLETNDYTRPVLWDRNEHGEMPRIFIDKKMLRSL